MTYNLKYCRFSRSQISPCALSCPGLSCEFELDRARSEKKIAANKDKKQEKKKCTFVKIWFSLTATHVFFAGRRIEKISGSKWIAHCRYRNPAPYVSPRDKMRLGL